MTTRIEPGSVPRCYPELTWSPIPLMSRRVVAALRACGVDNLQTFETRLIAPFGVEPPPPEDHIIGSVAAVDLQRAELDPERMDIHALVIDAEKARGLLLFRLAENVSTVIAHERVRAAVEAAGIETLSWLRPQQYAG